VPRVLRAAIWNAGHPNAADATTSAEPISGAACGCQTLQAWHEPKQQQTPTPALIGFCGSQRPILPFGAQKSPPDDINLISSQSGRAKAKLLKFKWEWLRACNLGASRRAV